MVSENPSWLLPEEQWSYEQEGGDTCAVCLSEVRCSLTPPAPTLHGDKCGHDLISFQIVNVLNNLRNLRTC